MTRPTTAPLPMQVQSLLPSAAETRMAMGMFAPDGPLRNGDGYYPTKPMSKNNKYKTRLKFSKKKSNTFPGTAAGNVSQEMIQKGLSLTLQI